MSDKKETRQEIVQKSLTEIANDDGSVTPKKVVDYAQPEGSPLHKYFEWDNEKAGDEYRLWQARELITSVRVTIQDREFNGWYNIRTKVDEKTVQSYFPAHKVASKKELHSKVLSFALLELKHWQEKYDNIVELVGVYEEVEEKVYKKSTDTKDLTATL